MNNCWRKISVIGCWLHENNIQAVILKEAGYRLLLQSTERNVYYPKPVLLPPYEKYIGTKQMFNRPPKCFPSFSGITVKATSQVEKHTIKSRAKGCILHFCTLVRPQFGTVYYCTWHVPAQSPPSTQYTGRKCKALHLMPPIQLWLDWPLTQKPVGFFRWFCIFALRNQCAVVMGTSSFQTTFL